MLLKEASSRLTKSELAHLGAGEVGYIRKMKSDEVSRCFRKHRRSTDAGPLGAVCRRWHTDSPYGQSLQHLLQGSGRRPEDRIAALKSAADPSPPKRVANQRLRNVR